MRGLIVVVAFVTMMISTDAFLMHGRQRCLCTRTINLENRKLIIQETVHQRSPTCDRVEIVVQVKRARFKKFCLNPNSTIGKEIQAKWNKKNRP